MIRFSRIDTPAQAAQGPVAFSHENAREGAWAHLLGGARIVDCELAHAARSVNQVGVVSEVRGLPAVAAAAVAVVAVAVCRACRTSPRYLVNVT